MKNGWMILLAACMGCATRPYTPMAPSSLKGEHVIFFEQSDRVPRVVMLAPWENRPAGSTGVMASAKVAIDPAIIAAIIEKILTVTPEIVKAYSDERMANAMIGRRILIRGYCGTNELAAIERIIKAMDGAVEGWTP